MMRHLLSFILLCSLFAGTAHATVITPPSGGCPTTSIPKPSGNNGQFEIGNCASQYTGNSYQPYEFTTKLVACIEGTIRSAVGNMMSIISSQFGWVTAALSTLVIMFFGVRIVSGERDLLKRGGMLFLKLAFISVFMNNLPSLTNAVFGTLGQLLALVAGGSPWQQIDTFLGKLVGFGPSIVLLNGLLGLVGAAMFSSTVGLMMFFFGILAILNLLNFILAMIYTYLLAFLTIGFLLILAPVMIPLAMFFYTERIFRKWVDITVSAILTPVLLFGFVWMFIGIFDILIQNIFDIMGGDDFRAYWRLNNSLFSWLMPSDANTNVMMQNLSTADDLPCVDRTIKPPVQTNINPLGINSFNAGVGRVATLDFGANDVNVVQSLSFAFATLWLFSSLMKSMVYLIPEIASSMASVSSNIAFGGNSALVGKIQSGLNKTQATLQKGVNEDGTKFNTISSFTKQMGNMVGLRDK